MSKKIIELSVYRKTHEQSMTRPVLPLTITPQLIHFDRYVKAKAVPSEFKSQAQEADLSDYRRRIANGDYMVNPEAIAESILRKLMPEGAETGEQPRFNPDRS